MWCSDVPSMGTIEEPQNKVEQRWALPTLPCLYYPPYWSDSRSRGHSKAVRGGHNEYLVTGPPQGWSELVPAVARCSKRLKSRYKK